MIELPDTRELLAGVGPVLPAGGVIVGAGAVATTDLVRFLTPITIITIRKITTASKMPRRIQYVRAGSGPCGWSRPLM